MTCNRRITIRLVLNVCAAALICIHTLALPEKVEAAVYKCIDASGNVSYNQVPCTEESDETVLTETVLSSTSTKKSEFDCRIANNFARQITDRMRSGQSSGEIFDSYGGIDAIPRTSVGIISYVYSHKDNIGTVSQRITALSATRCSAGSYGPVNCDDFPYDFIADLGGCEKATMKTTLSSPTKTTSNQTIPPVQEGATHSLGARTSSGNKKSDSTDCQKDVQVQLSELFNQMHSEQSDYKQDLLERQKKELHEQLTNC